MDLCVLADYVVIRYEIFRKKTFVEFCRVYCSHCFEYMDIKFTNKYIK